MSKLIEAVLQSSFHRLPEKLRLSRDFTDGLKAHPIPTLVTRPDGQIIFANTAAEPVLFHQKKPRSHNLYQLIHPDDAMSAIISAERTLHQGFDPKNGVEARIRTSDGNWQWSMLKTQATTHQGIPILINSMDEPIYHDALTGLHNLNFFQQEVYRHWKAISNKIGTVFIDVNGLKIVNDTLGHIEGDELLRDAAAIISSAVRKNDLLVRRSGDEFILLMNMRELERLAKPITSEEAEEAILRQIRNKLEEYNKKYGAGVSLAIGTKIVSNGSEINEGLKEAEHRMYNDKKAVKNV